MTKKSKSVSFSSSPPNLALIKFVFKLFLLAVFIAIWLVCLYLIITKTGEEKASYWDKFKEIPKVNFFKFFGLKRISIFLGIVVTGGFFYKYPFIRYLEAWLERKKFVEFAKGVHMALVSADVGRGKTLLMSILANSITRGIKKVGFISNVPDAQMLSYNDLNFDEPVPEMEIYRIPKYYFVDELNFMIEGTNFNENKIVHKGVSWLMAISRHHHMHCWFSMQRDNHAWIAIRQIANYYVKLGGIRPLMSIGGFTYWTQHIQFFSQQGELEKEFNILISNLDFELFGSFWLEDTKYFRSTYESIEEQKRLERERKQKERENKERELRNKYQFGLWGKKYISLTPETNDQEECQIKNEELELLKEAKPTLNIKELTNEQKNITPELDKKENLRKAKKIEKKKTYHKKKKSPLQAFLENESRN